MEARKEGGAMTGGRAINKGSGAHGRGRGDAALWEKARIVVGLGAEWGRDGGWDIGGMGRGWVGWEVVSSRLQGAGREQMAVEGMPSVAGWVVDVNGVRGLGCFFRHAVKTGRCS